MTTPEIVMWAVVGCIGLPAAYRNPTAAALSVSWLAGQVLYLATGNSLSPGTYIVADIAVITVAFAKAIVRAGTKSYPTARVQIRSFFTDLSVSDRFVVGLFLLGAWPIYVSSIHPYYQWWALFYITIAQFIFAGAEPLVNWHRRRLARLRDDQPNVLHFAPAFSRRAKRYFGAEPLPSRHSVEQPLLRGGGHG